MMHVLCDGAVLFCSEYKVPFGAMRQRGLFGLSAEVYAVAQGVCIEAFTTSLNTPVWPWGVTATTL